MKLGSKGRLGLSLLVAACGWLSGVACGSTDEGGGGSTVTTSASTSSGTTCEGNGSCGPNSDNCNCGLSCLHVNDGSYKCGYGCTTSADCAGKTNPTAGDAWNSCEPPHSDEFFDYDGFCL